MPDEKLDILLHGRVHVHCEHLLTHDAYASGWVGAYARGVCKGTCEVNSYQWLFVG